MYFELVRKIPKQQKSQSRVHSVRGRGQRLNTERNPEFSRDVKENNILQREDDKEDGNNSLGSRQGSNQGFPCDISLLPGLTGDPQSKALAVNVALSVCQGLQTWAETSDLNCILQKLRHLLCVVNENGDNALHTAIHNQQKEPFKKILETVNTSPDILYLINEPNLNNLTPLALAVSTNSVDFVQELIAHNADVSIPNSQGDNPLHIAVKANNVDCVKCLLQSTNAQSFLNKYNYSSMTALHLAALHGHVDVVDILCKFKADLTCQEGTNGRTPLHLAIEKEEISNIANTILLLNSTQHTDDILKIQNYRGDTPLHCVANLGHERLCAILLHFGADPKIRNFVQTDEEDDEEENGQSVFDVAANDKIRNLLVASSEEWVKVYKWCYSCIKEFKSSESCTQVKDIKTENSFFDSGINITDLTIFKI